MNKLPIISLLILLNYTNLFSQCDIDFADPLVVGNHVLYAIQKEDADQLRCTLNDVNQRKAINMDEMISYFQPFTEDVERIEEIRTYKRGQGVIWYICPLKAIGKEMMVIVLVKEKDKFVFEDINSPHIDDYNALPVLNP